MSIISQFKKKEEHSPVMVKEKNPKHQDLWLHRWYNKITPQLKAQLCWPAWSSPPPPWISCVTFGKFLNKILVIETVVIGTKRRQTAQCNRIETLEVHTHKFGPFSIWLRKHYRSMWERRTLSINIAENKMVIWVENRWSWMLNSCHKPRYTLEILMSQENLTFSRKKIGIYKTMN